MAEKTYKRMFRLLKADEIECRVSTCNEKGVSLLLYKDARCDMNILDETVGPMNWQKKYSRENANCEVGIYDVALNQWIWKEDTGTESNTEKEKGLASDSFKRACVNWGIGRELYTAPFIWVTADKVNLVDKPRGGGKTTYDKFDVTAIGYDSKGRINLLYIVNAKNGRMVFSLGNPNANEQTEDRGPQTDEQAMEEHYEDVRNRAIGSTRAKTLEKLLSQNGISVDTVYRLYKVKALAELTEVKHRNIVENIKGLLEKQEEFMGAKNGNQSPAA